MKKKPKYQLLQATGADALLSGMLRQPELLSCAIPLMVLGTQTETCLLFEEETALPLPGHHYGLYTDFLLITQATCPGLKNPISSPRSGLKHKRKRFLFPRGAVE